MPDIHCHVTAYSHDRTRHWLLAQHQAPTPNEALHWLRWRADRLAAAIDPDPTAPWYPHGSLHPADDQDQTEHAARLLRTWRDNPALHETALRQMTDADAEFTITLSSPTGHYVLSALSTTTAPQPISTGCEDLRSRSQVP